MPKHAIASPKQIKKEYILKSILSINLANQIRTNELVIVANP